MHTLQQPYRDLYDAMMENEGPADREYDELVRPWLRQQEGERAWLAEFGARRGNPIPEASTEDLWRLYAFSRIVDLVLREPQFTEFMDFFPLQRIERDEFHPFFHEIVSVGEEKEYWPGYMLGDLLIIRSGRGIAPRPGIVKELAEQSTMYWTWRRKHRPVEDMSHGWGSNSQWRTRFRRDYLIDGHVYYNVDAKERATDPESIELVRHRCYVQSTRTYEDTAPWSEKYDEDL
jgi:hypothetical protein